MDNLTKIPLPEIPINEVIIVTEITIFGIPLEYGGGTLTIEPGQHIAIETRIKGKPAQLLVMEL